MQETQEQRTTRLNKKKEYYLKNRDKYKQYCKERRILNGIIPRNKRKYCKCGKMLGRQSVKHCKSCHIALTKVDDQTKKENLRKYYKEKYLKNPEPKKNNYLKHRFGIDRKQYQSIVDSHNGHCAICNEKTNRMALDHCHISGTIRGFLCSRCNTALGGFRDSIKNLSSAIKYLQNELHSDEIKSLLLEVNQNRQMKQLNLLNDLKTDSVSVHPSVNNQPTEQGK